MSVWRHIWLMDGYASHHASESATGPCYVNINKTKRQRNSRWLKTQRQAERTWNVIWPGHVYLPFSKYSQWLASTENKNRSWSLRFNNLETIIPISSHTSGVTVRLTRSSWLYHTGGLKSHAFVSSRVTFHWSASNPYIWFFTSSAEESYPKLLPPNAFSELTKPQKCVGGRTLLHRTPLKEFRALRQISYSWIWGGRFATKKGKGCERIGEREGEGKEK